MCVVINYTVEMITLIEYVKQFFKNSPVRCHLPSLDTHKYGNIDKMTLKNVIYPKNAYFLTNYYCEPPRKTTTNVEKLM